MRPKIVILTLLAAFVVLTAVALLKNSARKNAPEIVGQGATALVAPTENPSGTNAQGLAAASSSNPAASDELRAALLDRQIEEIQNLAGQADGSNNPEIISALVAKLSQPGAEVHQAVLEGLKLMNDTNAVPPLLKAADAIQDAREKVAVLDTIDYLRLPSISDNVPAERMTNAAFVKVDRKAHVKRNPRPVAPIGQPQ